MVATGGNEQDLARRRHDLTRQLTQKGILRDKQTEIDSQSDKKQIGQAIKLGSEFLAAIVVGVMLGLGFDQVTGFSPWGLVVFLFLGFAAGILNMLRAVGYVQPHPMDRQNNNKSLD